MTVTDLFEFSTHKASVVYPINKPGTEKRVEKTASKTVSGRKKIMTKKAGDV
jgi:hypothetical protein